MEIVSDHFNPFVPSVPFLYPLKTSENRKGALGTNKLKFITFLIHLHLLQNLLAKIRQCSKEICV